jgi:hypothetical protein
VAVVLPSAGHCHGLHVFDHDGIRRDPPGEGKLHGTPASLLVVGGGIDLGIAEGCDAKTDSVAGQGDASLILGRWLVQ